MAGKEQGIMTLKITEDAQKQISNMVQKEIKSARLDGWINVLAGLGGNLDKRKNTYHSSTADEVLMALELDSIYRSDGLGARIVDAVADDMTREWIYLDREDEEDLEETDDDAKKIMAILTDLKAESAFNQALKWKRLFGGAVIIVGARDGIKLEEPINIKRVSSIDSLLVLDSECIDISTSVFGTDPAKADFGQPIKLHVQYTQGDHPADFFVHASRCLFFYGRPVPKSSLTTLDNRQRFWGMSILQHCYNSLRDLGGSMDSISQTLYELTVGKFKIYGLSNMLASGNEKKLIQRMNIIQMSKSAIRAVLLGDNEEWTRDTVTLAGVSDIIQLYMSRLSGVSGIPQTKLFGRSPAGMNATGESDTTQYYDMVKAAQRNEMRPQLTQLVDIIRAWLKVDAPYAVEFNPLFQLSEKEEAEVKKLKADAEKATADKYNIYMEAGVLTAEQVYEEEWSEIMGGYEEPEPEPDTTGGTK